MVIDRSITSRNERRIRTKHYRPGLLVMMIVLLAAGMPSAARAAGPATNAVREWNVIALKTIVGDKQNPLVAMRSITMVHLGIYDAVEAITTASNTGPYTLAGSSLFGTVGDASLESATAAAARTILIGIAPGRRSDVDTAYVASLAKIPDGAAKAKGVLVGFWAGQRVLGWRSDDGTATSVDYLQPTGLGIFQPVAPAKAVFAQWAAVRPITLQSAAQFRPGPPPALTSAQYAADYNEIKGLGAADSTIRTPDQTQIALFWVGDDSSMWDDVARSIATERQTTLVQDARMFAELNTAMLDALTAAFDAKYTYNSWRPQAAIRAGDLDGNLATTGDPAWTSLRPAPAHPDYPAAHPSSGGAASTVLASVFGDATTFSFTTLTAPSNAMRSYSSFSQAAEEEAASRVYIGFHFRTAVNAGLKLGRQVGGWTVSHFGPVIPANPTF
ncbi:MAG: vanadium-dependent haloperoxidase [Chloroflexota bacterium]